MRDTSVIKAQLRPIERIIWLLVVLVIVGFFTASTPYKIQSTAVVTAYAEGTPEKRSGQGPRHVKNPIDSHSFVTSSSKLSPPHRAIVFNFTSYVAQHLADSNIELLFVLNGLHGPMTDGIKVDFSAPTLSKATRHVRSLTEFRTQQLPVEARAAILLKATGASLDLHQAHLSTAIAAQLQGSLVSRLYYQTRAGADDYIVTYDQNEQILSAAFLSTTVHRDTFNRIYQSSSWSNEGGRSGPGSTLHATQQLRSALPDIITKYKITSLLDSSCGSMHWMPTVLAQVQQSQPGFRFKGIDVACSVVDGHKTAFMNQSKWDFECLDYAHQPLPNGFDLVLSRDSLQHLPMYAAFMFLNNVKASGAKYLLVGSYIKSHVPNKNIAAGAYYAIDLTKPPFNMREAIEIVDEQLSDGKHMLLFDVQQMSWEDDLAYVS